MKYAYPFIHLGEQNLKRPMYTDRAALQGNIEKCMQTITTFQEAITKEQETIFELKSYIKDLDAWERYKQDAGITEQGGSPSVQLLNE